MKLNLLPTHVSKEKVTRNATILGLFLLLIMGFASYWFLIQQPKNDLEASKTDIADLRGKATRAKETADVADQVMLKSTTLLRNTQLAEAMIKHNTVYPDTYDEIKRYIPSFFRVNSMSAAASGEGISTVTLVGVLDTYQQYADLMLAFLRIPGVASVSRSGFQYDPTYVPAPTAEDQWGKPRKQSEPPIPDDPLKRLAYFQAKGKVTGFTGTGGFGTGQDGVRGAMPNSSQVTITLVIAKDLRVPDPRATLLSSGASSTGGGTGPGGSGGTTPPAPGSSKGGGSDAGNAPTKSGRGNKKGAASDDEG